MVNLKLVGFVGDYMDDRSNLSLYLPVAESDGELYVPTRELWTEVEDLKRVDDNGRQFINMFDDECGIFPLRFGDLVFLAGIDFVDRCSRLPGLNNILKIDQKYPRYSYGEDYKYKTGNRNEFRELSIEIFGAARRGLLRSLSLSANPLDDPDVQDYYHVLCGVSDIDFGEWCAIRAIYYRETFCFDNYELIRAMAVSRGSFSSQEEFDSRIEREIAWSRQKRLQAVTISAPENRSSSRVASVEPGVISTYRVAYPNLSERYFAELPPNEILLQNNGKMY